MEFSEEIDYQKKAAAHSNYKFVRYSQVQGGQATTLSLTSTTQSQFEISGANVINLSKSKLCFDLLTALTTSNYIYTTANALGLFDRLNITTRSGVVLADVSYTDILGYLTASVRTKYMDFKYKNNNQNSTLIVPDTVAESRLIATSELMACNSTTAVNFNSMGSGCSIPYTEPAYLYRSAIGNASAISYQLDLSCFKDCICELDKSLLWNENLLINIYWNATTKYQWVCTSATDPSAGTPADANLPTMSNLFLYVAQDMNPSIKAQLASKIASGGFSITIPYIYSQLLSTSTGTNIAIQQRLNRSYGESLLRTYLGVFNTTNKWYSTMDHDVAPITSYNTTMDYIKLQDFTLANSDSTDWLVNNQHFQGSCMLSQYQYYFNWIHIDNFCANSVADTDPTVSDGLMLNGDKTWAANLTVTSAAYRVYAFFVCQKTLTIAANSITVA